MLFLYVIQILSNVANANGTVNCYQNDKIIYKDRYSSYEVVDHNSTWTKEGLEIKLTSTASCIFIEDSLEIKKKENQADRQRPSCLGGIFMINLGCLF
jgi:hypothetical protein